MSLETSDLDMIDRLIAKNTDDIAISISRSFERLENRIDSIESRFYSRVSDAEDKVTSTLQDLTDSIENLRSEMLNAGEKYE